jgi:hypothetical protein
MAILPLPQRGQPLDYDLFYQIIEAVNTIQSQVQSATAGNVIDKSAADQDTLTNVTTSETLIVAKKVSKKITANAELSKRQITVPFDSKFGSIPSVTVTPLVTSATRGSVIDSCYISSITDSSVDVVVSGTGQGIISVELQVIAIGLRSASRT